ncbi:hypothetical protein TYRP_022391 [Tyrophagus putrescentiae]|nr:hypothetical protein TYRP_022391 [Tyrophagus putrescentiae]
MNSLYSAYLQKFPRCYYTIAKEVFEGRVTHRQLRYSAAILLYIVFYANDPVLVRPRARYFAEVEDISEPLIGLSIVLFTAFDFFCQRAFLHLNVNTVTWRWWHELIVRNQDAYFDSVLPEVEIEKNVKKKVLDLVSKEKLFGYLPKKVVRILATVLVYYHFEHVDGEKLFSRKMKILPQISRTVRTRVLRFVLFTDRVSYVCLVAIALFYFGFLAVNFTTFLAFSNYWLSLGLIYMDFFSMIFGLVQMTQAAFFFTNCTILGTIVYTGHVRELYSQVEVMLAKYSSAGSTTISVLPVQRCYHVLANVLAEHNKVCYLVMRGCVELFGSVLLAFICTNLPVNVFLLRRNILLHYSTVSNLISWAIVLAQSMAAVVVFAPLAWCAEVYHRPKRWIPKLSMMLMTAADRPKWYLLQMKYDDLYGRLMHGPKIAINIGPVESITFRSALEFLFLYIAYVLMAFSQILSAGWKNRN